MDLNEIRKLVIIAMFTDDFLFEQLVLKGGNAISLIYGYGDRSSLDVDFSMEHEFQDVDDASARIRHGLEDRFGASGYVVFDYKFGLRPVERADNLPENWGGYRAEFKIIEEKTLARLDGDVQAIRRHASVIGPSQLRTFVVDISKCEYCEPKMEKEIEDYTIFVYTPSMLAIEKLRAICQQMPSYALRGRKTPRARDFYDIWQIITSANIDITEPDALELAVHIFAAKSVDVKLLREIASTREFHRPDWIAVENSVAGDLKEFDYYFDFVVEESAKLTIQLEQKFATQGGTP